MSVLGGKRIGHFLSFKSNKKKRVVESSRSIGRSSSVVAAREGGGFGQYHQNQY